MKEYLEKIYRELDAVTHCKAADSATLENIEDIKQSISRILADENNKIFAVPQSAAELEQKYPEKVPEEMQDVYIRESFAAYEAQGFMIKAAGAPGNSITGTACPVGRNAALWVGMLPFYFFCHCPKNSLLL